MSKGVLAVVSGFSGAGKGTVMKKLLESFDDYALSVSVTTRKPRPERWTERITFSAQKKKWKK